MPHADVDGARLYYEQSGEGPDIVWLAAGDHPGANWRRWQVPAFEPGWRNTTYDARGVGQTTSESESPWPIKVHSEDVIQLIEQVCEPPVALVGLSMGSLIAVQTAHDRPDLVACVAAMGTCVKKTGFIWEWEEAEIELRRSGATLPSDFATAHYALLYYPAEVLGDDDLWAELRDFIAADFSDRDGAMLAAQWQACLEYDSSELLPETEPPIHVISFSEDVQTPPQRGRLVAELAKNGHFHLLQGLGHGSAFGHRPDEVNACVRGIVEGYLPPA